MKFRSTSSTTEAAMQLLVDPMCNFFAGLVFLSILVAVLAKNQPSSSWREKEPGRTFSNRELLTARLAEIRDETAELQKENRAKAEKLGSVPSLPSLSALEKALAEVGREETQAGGLNSPETRARMEGALLRERDRLRSRHLSLGNEMISLQEESVRLQGRLDRLAGAPEKPGAGSSLRVRLPLARTATQSPLYILVSGGSCHPLQDAGGKEDSTYVERQRTEAVDEVRPRPGKGMKAGPAMETFFQQINPDRFYPVLVVYADSYGEYATLRKILETREQAYGFEPRPAGSPFRLSAQGVKPEMQ